VFLADHNEKMWLEQRQGCLHMVYVLKEEDGLPGEVASTGEGILNRVKRPLTSTR
jgi:hypothetical protein